MKKQFRLVKSCGKLLLSTAVGVLSTMDKHYSIAGLCAPALTAGAGSEYLSRHGIIIGQLIGIWCSAHFERLPVLMLIYLLVPLFSKKKNTLSPIALSGIMTIYEILLYFLFHQNGVELLLGLCNGLLSGCALFFSVNLTQLSPKKLRSVAGCCNLFLVGTMALLICDAPLLDDLPLWFGCLSLILLCGRLPMWQAGVMGTGFAVLSALIAADTQAIPVFLAAVSAVCVMGRFGKKRYTVSLLFCTELALLPTGLWLEQMLLLLMPPLAAGAHILLPLQEKIVQPPPKQELDGQYKELVDRVDKLQQAAGKRITFYPEYAARAAELLTNAGASDINVTCAKDLLGGFFLDVSMQGGEFTPSALLGLMERACGFSLTIGKYHQSDEEIYACFVRRPPLTVKCAALCKTKEGETICGDSALAFSADQNHYILLLSDGMGSGKDAFAQSRWTVTLLQKLLRAGMNAEGAIGMVHSSLKLAQQDIAFATADLCSIDLQNGQANFFKAGAVSTFILRNEQILEVYGVSMPLGAPDAPDVASRSEQLEVGDLILLISDGAYERKDEILYTFQKHRSLPLRSLAKELMQTALPQGQADDDTTVLIAQICKNGDADYEYRKEQN